eukprot:TRINITY_DN22681_c1_g3_i1.p1 TRINITY_DN22681_c1_g3~~TRINITY_DN22681_c1_g3_i1.p1  ORF type:complete len:1455 (-),score=242.31 TRINITY_DN22681_c1_g3_i1:647-4459(-)
MGDTSEVNMRRQQRHEATLRASSRLNFLGGSGPDGAATALELSAPGEPARSRPLSVSRLSLTPSKALQVASPSKSQASGRRSVVSSPCSAKKSQITSSPCSAKKIHRANLEVNVQRQSKSVPSLRADPRKLLISKTPASPKERSRRKSLGVTATLSGTAGSFLHHAAQNRTADVMQTAIRRHSTNLGLQMPSFSLDSPTSPTAKRSVERDSSPAQVLFESAMDCMGVAVASPDASSAASDLDDSVATPGVLLQGPGRADRLNTLMPTSAGRDSSMPACPCWGEQFEKDSVPSWQLQRKDHSLPTGQRLQKVLDRRIDGELSVRLCHLRSIARTPCAEEGTIDVPRSPFSIGKELRGARDQASRQKISDSLPPKVAAKLSAPSCPVQNGAAARAYLDGAETRHLLPLMPRCVHDSTQDGAVRFDIENLNLSDEQVISMLEGLKEQSSCLSCVLVGGNPRLTDVSFSMLLRLIQTRLRRFSGGSGVKLTHLDISEAQSVSSKSIGLLSKELYGQLRHLSFLSMRGVCVSEEVWPTLVNSVQALNSLEQLCFSGMHIGRWSQNDALCVADVLVGAPALTSLDLSNNYFSFDGCRALAENLAGHARLEIFDLSHNAGGLPVLLGHGGSGAVAAREKAFNPVALVCEGCAHAQALRILRLAHCQLSFDEAFVLEDAFAEQARAARPNTIEELDLRGNPCQGPMGARCLLRLLSNTPSLRSLVVMEFCRAPCPDASVPYEYTDPSASYALDLAHPQHRALLRTLVRRCAELGGKLEERFQFQDPRAGQDALQRLKQGQLLEGTLRFAFNQASDDAAGKGGTADLGELINSVGAARKIRMSLWAIARMSEFFRHLCSDVSRAILVNAMASDFLLKLSHVKYISEITSSMRVFVIDHLLPAVHRLDGMGGMDLLLQAGRDLSRRSILNMLLFNPCVPTGRYLLSMDVPSDRKIMEQIIIINGWESMQAKVADHPDLSRHGGHECLRNAILNEESIVWRNSEFTLPHSGSLSFDYCSPFHPHLDAPRTATSVVERLAQVVQSSRCELGPKVQVLRTVLHKMVLSPEHVALLVALFPSITEQDGEGAPRVDAFVPLYTRCADIGGLLATTPCGLYGLELLQLQEILMVRSRLGRLRTWDLVRADATMLPCQSFPAGISVTERKALAEQEWLANERNLAGFNLRDDPTARGNANRYCFDLAVFEDWQAARCLLQLGAAEEGPHFDNPTWSEKAHLSHWLIPPEWITTLPNIGILRFHYFLERDSFLNLEARKRMAAKFLAW